MLESNKMAIKMRKGVFSPKIKAAPFDTKFLSDSKISEVIHAGKQ